MTLFLLTAAPGGAPHKCINMKADLCNIAIDDRVHHLTGVYILHGAFFVVRCSFKHSACMILRQENERKANKCIFGYH